MKRGNRTKSCGKIVLGGLALAALAFVMPATPLAPASSAEACRGHHHYRRYTPATTKTKVGGRWELKISYYNKFYNFDGGSYRLQYVTVYTKSDKVADFIHKQGTNADFWNAVRAGASRYTCEDLLKGTRLVKLEQGLAGSIARYYQKKTRQSAGTVDVMLTLYAPYRAYCNPKKSKYASRP